MADKQNYNTNDFEKDLEILLGDDKISLNSKKIIVKMANNPKGHLYKTLGQ